MTLRRVPHLAFLAAAACAPASLAQAQSTDESSPSMLPGGFPDAGVTQPFDGIPGSGMARLVEMPENPGGFLGNPYGSAPVLPPGPAQTRRAIEFVPSIGAQVMATDNVFPGRGSRDADIVTTITPDLRITADTSRVQGVVRYAPSLNIYAADGDQSRIDHRLNGSALTTVVPGSVFLDLRGSASVIPVTGGFADRQSESVRRDDRSQNLSFSATPYYIRRFGSYATSLIGYTYQYGHQGGTSTSLTPTGAPFSSAQEFSSHTAMAVVRSGDSFGPFAAEARANGTVYQGNGVLDGASRYLGIVETRYAFNRTIIGIAEAGYENQEYGGVPPTSISGPVGAVGVKLDLGPGSSVTARYQRRDGFNSPTLNARLSLGASTVFFATYSDQLGTNVQRSADLLSTTVLDQFGNPVDSRTGDPTPYTAGSLLAQQNGLFRNRRLSSTLTKYFLRDTISLNVGWDERIPVATEAGDIALQQKSTSAGVTWTRALSAETSLTGSFRYGWVETTVPGVAGQQDGNSYSARAVLAHQFNPTLLGSLQYLLSNRSFDAVSSATSNDDSSLQNAVIVNLRKTF